MRAIIDTNVIIDALQSRKGFMEEAGWVLLKADKYDGFITANSVTDIFYVHNRFVHNKNKTKKDVASILELFDVLDTTDTDCRNALRSSIPDFEDAVLVESAIREGIDVIVTRNKKDFKNSPIRVCTPIEFLENIAAKRTNR